MSTEYGNHYYKKQEMSNERFLAFTVGMILFLAIPFFLMDRENPKEKYMSKYRQLNPTYTFTEHDTHTIGYEKASEFLFNNEYRLKLIGTDNGVSHVFIRKDIKSEK